MGDATLEDFGVVSEMQSVELSAANNLAKEHRIVATADMTKNLETVRTNQCDGQFVAPLLNNLYINEQHDPRIIFFSVRDSTIALTTTWLRERGHFMPRCSDPFPLLFLAFEDYEY